MEYINGWEWLPLIICTMAGFIMIAFTRRGDIAFVGTIMIFMTIMLAYEIHNKNLGKEFVLKRFIEGQALECGLWRGESAFVDPKSDWKWDEKIGLVKGDQIHNDLGVCTVIGEESPNPAEIPYIFVLIFELMLAFGLRAVFTNWLTEQEKNDHEKREIKKLDVQEQGEDHANT
jgi:hypothetical protein